MEENTYIASKEKSFSFFCDSFTYIASKSTASSESPSINLPISIFQNDLSALEAVTKYLKEEKQLRFCEIAKLTSRDDRTIWDAYDGASKKQPGAQAVDSKITIPLSIFSNRGFSMLESLTLHLKEICNLRFCHIATLLNKDARTIWTVYNRIQKKRKNAATSVEAEAAIFSTDEKHASNSFHKEEPSFKSQSPADLTIRSSMQPFLQSPQNHLTLNSNNEPKQ